MLSRLSLRLRVFLLFAALGAGAVLALILGLGLAYHRLAAGRALDAFVQGGLVGAFGIIGLMVWIWFLFDLNVAKPIGLLSGALRARAHADVSVELDQAPARFLGDLAPAVSATAATLTETRHALTEAVARETIRLAREKGRLEVLLSDVSVGVLLCSADHQLVFYNSAASDLIGAVSLFTEAQAGMAAVKPGLDRKLFDYLREGPVLHGYARLVAAQKTSEDQIEAASDLLCSTRDGKRLLSVRMRLLRPDPGLQPGYVLTLSDVTGDLAAHAKREALLDALFEGIRRPAANLQMLLAALPKAEPLPMALEKALRSETDTLAQVVTEFGAQHEEGRFDSWPLALTRASDLVDGLRARLEAQGLDLAAAEAPLLLRCNGYEVVTLLANLVQNLAQTGAEAFHLTWQEDGRETLLRLHWQGLPLAVGLLESWLGAALDTSMPDLTGRNVLSSHAIEIWPEAGLTPSLCLPLRSARHAGPRPKPISRSVVYDFDLLGKDRNAAVIETALADLTYVVFDTETTGLSPDKGDEIVQIAAVRIVNGRRVAGEVFDRLVNPARSIPARSTQVHGITDAMVQHAAGPVEAGRAFHKFAEGAVLIAHNAPFDMAFLRRHEAAIGAVFDNPVLDTVLLSAVIFGQHEVHSLDALANRLGITIPEEARHTALGDTVATAEAFLKLLPMLQGRGLTHFGDVLSEVRRHGRLLKDLN
jgi:DNA polymerase-3 subunit epsilon